MRNKNMKNNKETDYATDILINSWVRKKIELPELIITEKHVLWFLTYDSILIHRKRVKEPSENLVYSHF